MTGSSRAGFVALRRGQDRGSHFLIPVPISFESAAKTKVGREAGWTPWPHSCSALRPCVPLRQQAPGPSDPGEEPLQPVPTGYSTPSASRQEESFLEPAKLTWDGTQDLGSHCEAGDGWGPGMMGGWDVCWSPGTPGALGHRRRWQRLSLGWACHSDAERS